MLSRYPDISPQEANKYLDKLEHEDNIAVGKAIIGIISESQLNDDAKQTFREFKRWSNDRTSRTRQGEIAARRNNKQTDLALKLNRMFQQGKITEETLVLYGISGELPDRNLYVTLSPEEKQEIWSRRMENTYGPNWRRSFRRTFIQKIDNEINWKQEGF